MKKGDVSPLMAWVLALIMLLAIIVLVMTLRAKSFNIIELIRGKL